MPSQKLVRCTIRRAGAAGARMGAPAEAGSGPESGTARFVPLEIFGLWEYLMSAKHGFEVVEPTASLWLDMEDSPEAAYADQRFDRVTEVTAFVYSGRDEMFTKACRYFPTRECDHLRTIFLGHYQAKAGRLQTHVRERPGIWVHRPSPVAVAE